MGLERSCDLDCIYKAYRLGLNNRNMRQATCLSARIDTFRTRDIMGGPD